jgi:hypothetical protein
MTREEAEAAASVRAFVVVKSHDRYRDSAGRITYVRGKTATVVGGDKGGERYPRVEDVRLDKSRNLQHGISVPQVQETNTSEPWVVINVKDLTGWTGTQWVEADEKWLRFKSGDDAKHFRQRCASNGMTGGIESLPESKAIARRDSELERLESTQLEQPEQPEQAPSQTKVTAGGVAKLAGAFSQSKVFASSVLEHQRLMEEADQLEREGNSDTELAGKLESERMEIERRITAIHHRQGQRSQRLSAIQLELIGTRAKITQVLNA